MRRPEARISKASRGPDAKTMRRVTTALEEFSKEELVDFLARTLIASGMDLKERWRAQARRIEHKANRLWHDAYACKNEYRKSKKMARARALTARASLIREEARGVVSKEEGAS